MNGSQSMRFGPAETPKIIQQLMIANLIVFVAQQGLPSISDLGAIRPGDTWLRGYLWQPFTYMWLHGGILHLAVNCFVLWMFGSDVALTWGPKRFLRYYLLCGIGAGFIIATWPFLPVLFSPYSEASGMDTSTLGASGAVYGALLAYSMLWPDRRIMLIFPPVSFRAIWLIPLLFVMTLVVSGGAGDVSHIGHLGGVVVAWLYLRRHGLTTGLAGSSGQRASSALKRRWRRLTRRRMRKRLRAVGPDEAQQPRKDDDPKESDRAR